MSDTFSDAFLDNICSMPWIRTHLFVLNTILLVMLLVVAPFIEWGSGSFVTALIALAILGVSYLGIGIVHVACRRAKKE
jgi:hypothetical protein